MLGPRREQEEMESLAFGRHQERGNSVAQACVVLSPPCCCWSWQKSKARLKMLFAFAGLILSPVTCACRLLLGTSSTVSGGL